MKSAPAIPDIRSHQVSGAQVSGAHRFHLLDGLRGVAALLVVVYHVPPYLHAWFPCPNSFLAVDFFFCLSGFVIAYSYESRILGGMSFANFGLSRLIRLYPLYLAGTMTGLLSAIFVVHAYSRNHLHPIDLLISVVLSLLLLPNLGRSWANHCIFPFDGPAWSLCFEIFANLIFWCFIRIRIATNLVLLVSACGSFVVLALRADRLADVGTFTETFSLGFARVGFSFCVGVLIYRIYKGRHRALWQGVEAAAVASAVVVLLAGTLLTRGKLAEQHATQLFIIAFVFPLTVYLGSMVSVPAAAEPLCKFFGDFSYPVYILHESFLVLVAARTFRIFTMAHPVTTIFSVPAFCFAVAGTSWCIGAYCDAPVRAYLTRKR